jgi:hypothetical protein
MGNITSGIRINEAIEIAKAKLCEKNQTFCNQDFEIIDADEKNTRWEKAIATAPQILDLDNIKQMKLNNKEYWAIYFQKKKETIKMGKDVMILVDDRSAYVFIEKDTGKLIGFLF